jgi:hypothetical protein
MSFGTHSLLEQDGTRFEQDGKIFEQDWKI